MECAVLEGETSDTVQFTRAGVNGPPDRGGRPLRPRRQARLPARRLQQDHRGRDREELDALLGQGREGVGQGEEEVASTARAWPAGLCAARYRCSTGRPSPRRSKHWGGAENAPLLVARHQPGRLGEHGYRAAHSPACLADAALQSRASRSARAHAVPRPAAPGSRSCSACQPAARAASTRSCTSSMKACARARGPVRARNARRSPPRACTWPGAENTPSANSEPEPVRVFQVLPLHGRAGMLGEEVGAAAARRQLVQQRDALPAMGVSSAGSGIDDAACLFRPPARCVPVMRSARARPDVAAVRSRPSRRRSLRNHCTSAAPRPRRAMLGQRARQAVPAGAWLNAMPPKSNTTFMRRSLASRPGGRSVEPVASPEAMRSRSLHSALPSSTPHWSKLLMPHSAPLVKTRCSYIAISVPTQARRELIQQQRGARPVAGKVRCLASVAGSSAFRAVGALVRCLLAALASISAWLCPGRSPTTCVQVGERASAASPG